MHILEEKKVLKSTIKLLPQKKDEQTLSTMQKKGIKQIKSEINETENKE